MIKRWGVEGKKGNLFMNIFGGLGVGLEMMVGVGWQGSRDISCLLNGIFLWSPAVHFFLETLNSRDNTQTLLSALQGLFSSQNFSELHYTVSGCRGKHGSYLTSWISFVNLLSSVKKKKPKVYFSFTAVPQQENRSIWNCFTTRALDYTE